MLYKEAPGGCSKTGSDTPKYEIDPWRLLSSILLDARQDGTIYHWIVQRVGSATIVQWGQEYTFEDAHSAVITYLENLSHTDEKKA